MKRVGKMAQQIKVLATKTGDLNLLSGTHIKDGTDTTRFSFDHCKHTMKHSPLTHIMHTDTTIINP